MHGFLPRGVWIVAVVAGLASPLAAQTSVGPIRSTMLDNGLQVVVLPKTGVPFVTIECVVRAGAFTQTSDAQAGLPHLIEHLLFRTSDDDTFGQRAARLEAIANGVTDAEAASYFLILPSKKVGDGVELLADLVRKPSFDKKAIEAEQSVVRGELERRASDPDFLLTWQSEQLLWEGPGWRAKNAGGNLIAILGATPKTLEELYRKYYVPNNAALIVAGDVSDTVAFELARKSFGGWKRGDDPIATTPAPQIAPLGGIRRKLLSAEAKEVTLLVEWQGPRALDDRADTYAADVFSGVVNQPLSGTHRRLVDGGLVDDVSLSYDTRRYGGAIELAVRTSPDRAAAAAAALGDELSRLVRADYFDDDDLAIAKQRQRVVASLRMENAAGAAHMLAHFWSATDLPYFVTYADSLDARRASDVRAYTDRYLKGKPMVVTALIPGEAWNDVSGAIERALAAWRVP